jgi:hypothetical protein
MVARGSTVYHYDFEGTVSGAASVPLPAALSSITGGDTFFFSFDVDTGTDQVENIDANFASKGIDLYFPGVDTSWTWYTITSPYEYRFDFNIPGMSPYTMIFWFRSTTPGVVTGGVPPTITANQFNYLHDFDIYENQGDGGPQALNVSLENTPEPGTLGLTALSILGIAALGRRRRRSCFQA